VCVGKRRLFGVKRGGNRSAVTGHSILRGQRDPYIYRSVLQQVNLRLRLWEEVLRPVGFFGDAAAATYAEPQIAK
jgi:hypothetical protein